MTPSEKLISESVRPLFDGEGPVVGVAGEPRVPSALVWRGATWPVLAVLESGRGLGPCTHDSGERYVRKHWYVFQSTGGARLRVYFERRARGRAVQRRWWLYSLAEGAGGPAS